MKLQPCQLMSLAYENFSDTRRVAYGLGCHWQQPRRKGEKNFSKYFNCQKINNKIHISHLLTAAFIAIYSVVYFCLTIQAIMPINQTITIYWKNERSSILEKRKQHAISSPLHRCRGSRLGRRMTTACVWDRVPFTAGDIPKAARRAKGVWTSSISSDGTGESILRRGVMDWSDIGKLPITFISSKRSISSAWSFS